MEIKLTRLDYLQVGLTSRDTLQLLDFGDGGPESTVIAVVGDQTGCVHCFAQRSDSANIETIFKTLPTANAKINCLQIISSLVSGGSPKILTSHGSSVIRGYNKKGKQFFGLELNNLTEPIKHLQILWPNDVFICGQYIYNHYILNTELVGNDRSTIIQSKNFYVSPGKITAFIVIQDRIENKPVPIISCEDRLIRILKDSACQYEIETCGIANTLYHVDINSVLASTSTVGKQRVDYSLFCYGTLEGKVALITLDFTGQLLEATHKWQIPESGSKAPVNCLSMMEKTGELYIGRTDGTIEIWIFTENLDTDGRHSINFDCEPVFRTSFSCGESLTSICVCRDGTFLLCCTFTGVIFGLTRNESSIFNIGSNSTSAIISRDAELKIEMLRGECDALESKLTREREKYQEMTSIARQTTNNRRSSTVTLSALPYFAINESMILQDDACYLLTFETEVAIDATIIQCDIPLDLIDCEKNSAVVSFNEDSGNQLLATFRCQANTTRLDIKIRTIEGQCGILRVYVMTRMTPKSCQMKQYTIKALSLHKRSYITDTESLKQQNRLRIFGSFSLNEALNWMQLCLPEIPEKINLTTSTVLTYSFTSTLTATCLTVECSKGSLSFASDNVSSISILKDFITREATKKSIQIEMNVSIDRLSLSTTLGRLFPKLQYLVHQRWKEALIIAIKEISVSDSKIAQQMMIDLEKNGEIGERCTHLTLDRLYGLITDLFIDFYKLDLSTAHFNISTIKNKLKELPNLIESSCGESDNCESFINRLFQFWGLQNIT